MAAGVDGIVSGLSTGEIISQLMQLERRPQLMLRTQRAGLVRLNELHRSLNTRLAAVTTAAKALTGLNGWNLAKATSSDDTRVKAAAVAGAASATLTFKVADLATASSVRTTGTVASTATAVADGPILLSKGATALGFSALDQGATLASGAHTLEVTSATNDGGGTDAVIELDGVVNTFTDVQAGATITLVGADGDTVEATLGAGGLAVGTATAHNVELADGATLAQVVSAINGANAGVTAAAVQVSEGVFHLQLASTTTGERSAIGVDPDAFPGGLSGLGGLTTLTEGGDAQLVVGDGPGQYTVTRSSNTISDLLEGTTLTLLTADPATSVTVTTGADAEGVATQVQKMVEAVNAALKEIRDNSSYDPDTKTAGPLLSDSLARRLQQQLVSAVSSAVAGTAMGSPGLAGVSVQRDGTVTFDRAKFLAGYAADPAGINALLGAGAEGAPGVAGRLESLGADYKEMIDAALKQRGGQLRTIDGKIDDWDRRLELRETALRRQFNAMESALGRMQQQSQWLAGQLGGLMATSNLGKRS